MPIVVTVPNTTAATVIVQQVQGPAGSAGIGVGTPGQALFTNVTDTAIQWASVSGDASASATTIGRFTVTGLQGRPVSATAPTTGQALVWGGASWGPGSVGSGSISPGTAGQIFVTNGTPASAWTSLISYETTHGRFTSGGSGLDASATIGPLVSNETAYSAIYLLANGTAPTSLNWSILTDSTRALYFKVGASASYTFEDSSGNVRATIESTHGKATFGGGGSDYKAIVGPLVGFETSDAGIWFVPAATTPTSANVALWCDASNTFMNNGNGSAVLGFIVAGSTYLGAFNGAQSRFYVGGSTASAPLIFDWATSLQSQIMSGSAQTSLLVANTNASGSVILQGGSAGITWRDSGQVQRGSIELVHGRATFGAGGSDFKVVAGPYVGAETTNGALWILAGATAPSGSNWILQSDGTFSYYGSTSGFYFYQAAAPIAHMSTASLMFDNVPLIQFGTALSSGTLGTSKAAATLTLQVDAAASLMQLAGGTQNGVALGTHLATVGHIRTPSGWVWESRRADNAADLTTFMDDGANHFYIAQSYTSVTIGSTSFTSEVDILTASIIAFETGGTIYSDATNFQWRDNSHVAVMTWALASGGATTGSVSEGVTSFTLGYTARSGDAATHDIKLQGQYAFATATGTNRTPGNVVFDIGVPTNSGTTEAAFKFTRAGSETARIATHGTTTSQVALWLGSSAFAADQSNAALISDGNSYTYLNTHSSGALGLTIADASFLVYMPGAANQAFWFGSSAAAPFYFDITAGATLPKIVSGTGATSFTLGTTKSGASAIFQGDAATTILTLTTIGEFATAVKMDSVATPSAFAGGSTTYASSGRLACVDSDGTVILL
jgi:hypothetical protein